MSKGALCLSWGAKGRTSIENNDMVWCATWKWFQLTWLKQQELDELAEIIDELAVENIRLQTICANRGIDV